MPIEEVWSTIQGLERYAVSNYGRVINQETGRDLKGSPTTAGYWRVKLSYNGKTYEVYIHRLVAYAFFLNYKPGIQVRHINGDLSDNTVLNLSLGVGCRSSEADPLGA